MITPSSMHFSPSDSLELPPLFDAASKGNLQSRTIMPMASHYHQREQINGLFVVLVPSTITSIVVPLVCLTPPYNIGLKNTLIIESFLIIIIGITSFYICRSMCRKSNEHQHYEEI